ncbi:MAG: YkoF family thiamine/hydroxymethylpyrimidine-binding protein [Gammaproteobacteria bacterium]
MKITVDISMYPLADDYKPAIKAFIRRLRESEGLALVTNQLSTQINGEYEAVTTAINACIRESMEQQDKVVFVAKYLSANLDITRLPDID